MNRLFLLIVALATTASSIPTSAKVDPRAVAFTAFGTYVALDRLHSLIQKPLICETEQYGRERSTSDKVIRQVKRIVGKIGSSWLFALGTGLAITASRDPISGDASKATIAGSLIGGLTMGAGYTLLIKPSLIKRYESDDSCCDNERPGYVKHINRILGKIGALGLIVLGGLIVANPEG